MHVTWLDTGETITTEALRAEGVHTDSLPTVAERYQPAIDRLKDERGYVAQDIIELRPDTEGLDAICAKFDPEHHHDDDEVRFVLEGAGVFDIRSRDDRYMRVRVEAGDLIVVPAGRPHRFELTDARMIRCVRLYQDAAGWLPHYRPASRADPS